MNREQRRKYEREIKKEKAASKCPECGHLALFYTAARGEKDTVVKCPVCGKIICEGEEVTKLVPPGITIPLPIEQFKKVLLFEASRVEEKKNDERPEDLSVSGEDQVAGGEGSGEHQDLQ